MKKLIFLLPFVLFIGMIGFFIIGLERDPHLIPSPLIGKAAPAFELPVLGPEQNGSSAPLTQSDLQGSVSLLNFWATWCPTCLDEHEVLNQIVQTGAVRIYGIDYKDDKNDALQWLKRLGNPYQIVGFDPEGKVGIDWGVYGTPETFVLDAKGIVRYRHVGPVSWEVWTETLEPLVKQLKK